MIKVKLLVDDEGFTGVDAPWARGSRHMRWRARRDGYVELCDEGGVRTFPRTTGEPVTARRVRDLYSGVMRKAFEVSTPSLATVLANTGTPTSSLPHAMAQVEHLVLATICAESKGNPTAERFEKHINDWSIGLMQTLTKTAAAVTELPGEPAKPIPAGGKLEWWRAFLREPFNSIAVGADLYLTVLATDHRYWGHADKPLLDPVLAYATYNAGSARHSASTPLGLVYYTDKETKADAMMSFLRWYNDVGVVLAE